MDSSIVRAGPALPAVVNKKMRAAQPACGEQAEPWSGKSLRHCCSRIARLHVGSSYGKRADAANSLHAHAGSTCSPVAGRPLADLANTYAQAVVAAMHLGYAQVLFTMPDTWDMCVRSNAAMHFGYAQVLSTMPDTWDMCVRSRKPI